jgi:FMN phosphatase YigB (HAD superfamily)
MSTIKHISLDFWNTLGIPNPEFADARIDYLASLIGCPRHEIYAHYKDVKQFLDGAAEKFGTAFDSTRCWEIFLEKYQSEDFYAIFVKMEVNKLFVKYPPTILPETVAEIVRLSKKGITFSVGSNTNFIPGVELSDVIRQNKLHLTFSLYSDDFGISKPAHRFFREIHARTKVRVDEIVHIGDSVRCDYEGALKFGMKAIVVGSAHKLPEVLATL